MSTYTKIKSWFNPTPQLQITFTPETPEQKQNALAHPWWEAEHSKQAKELISAEAIRRGQRTPFERGSNGCIGGCEYGSGWFIEFPRYVATLIGERGVEAAAEYVKWTFDEGSCKDAGDQIMKANPDENPCVAYYGE